MKKFLQAERGGRGKIALHGDLLGPIRRTRVHRPTSGDITGGDKSSVCQAKKKTEGQ